MHGNWDCYASEQRFLRSLSPAQLGGNIVLMVRLSNIIFKKLHENRIFSLMCSPKRNYVAWPLYSVKIHFFSIFFLLLTYIWLLNSKNTMKISYHIFLNWFHSIAYNTKMSKQVVKELYMMEQICRDGQTFYSILFKCI